MENTKIAWATHRNTGENNPNWRGGRLIASNGYVLMRVGVGHHLADIRGYAYEHRLVAEKILGRRLLADELVHHRNGEKTDNRIENIEVVKGNAEHFFRHRLRSDLRGPGELNPVATCECGCGAVFDKYDGSGRPRRFVSGHNGRTECQVTTTLLGFARDGIIRTNEIVGHFMPRSSFFKALRRLLAAGKVCLISRGLYKVQDNG